MWKWCSWVGNKKWKREDGSIYIIDKISNSKWEPDIPCDCDLFLVSWRIPWQDRMGTRHSLWLWSVLSVLRNTLTRQRLRPQSQIMTNLHWKNLLMVKCEAVVLLLKSCVFLQRCLRLEEWEDIFMNEWDVKPSWAARIKWFLTRALVWIRMKEITGRSSRVYESASSQSVSLDTQCSIAAIIYGLQR